MNKRKYLSFVIVLLLTVLIVNPVSVMADEKDVLDNSNILKYINEESFKKNDYKRRLNEEEALNTYVFERNDVQRELYMFDDNVI